VILKVKKIIFHVIGKPDTSYAPSVVFDVFIITLVILNTLGVIFDTLENMPPDIISNLTKFEDFVIVVFTVEYALRVWTADLLYPDKSPTKARLRYIFSFLAVVDLLAILPFYLPVLIPVNLSVFRTLRLVRLFRLFKLERYTDAFHIIAAVLKRKAGQLLSSVFIVFILLLISSVLMYNFEHAAQPDKFRDIFSSFWWAVCTLTTVGYGDMFPVTTIGKTVSAFISLLGVGIVALPTGIISAGFVEVSNERKHDKAGREADKPPAYCPYCGEQLPERGGPAAVSTRGESI